MKGNTKLRQDNIKRIFCEIRDRGPISKRELQELTEFSWGSISTKTTGLEESGYIMSAGKQTGAVGRRPEEYDINITDNFIIGIDLSSVGFFVAVTDLRGRVVREYRQNFSLETTDTAISKLFDTLDGVLKELDGFKVWGFAVAVQGAVRDERISVAVNGISGWKNVPLADILEEKFGINTILIHDPDCIIRTEKYFGKLKNPDIKNAFLLRVDHGIGMSIMTDRNPYIGCDGKSGEIGYNVVPRTGGTGFVRLDSLMTEGSLIKNYCTKTGFDGDITCTQIAERARGGEDAARELFEEIGTALGLALTNAVNLLYPETVVIYGTFSAFADLYIKTAQRVLNENVYDTSVGITVSDLSYDAAAVGAALCAGERLIETFGFGSEKE